MAILALAIAAAFGAGPYPAMKSSLKLSSKQDLMIPPETCALVELQLTKEKAVVWDETITGFTPQILVSENKRKDGACWVDVNAKDSAGAQATCRNCKVLWSGLPLGEVCYKATTVFYIEIFNPGPDMGTFTYENARLETPSVPCDDSLNPSPSCTAADVPSCTVNGDGTGGQIVGDPGKMTCQCQCISGWKPPDCDVKDFPPTPVPQTPIPPTPLPTTAVPTTAVPTTVPTPQPMTNSPVSTAVPAGTTLSPGGAVNTTTTAPVAVTSLPAGMTYSPSAVPSPSPAANNSNTTTSPTAAVTTASPPNPSASDSSDGSEGSEMWWIGIALGGAAVLIAIAVAVYWLCCRERSSKDRNSSINPSTQELMCPPQLEVPMEAKPPVYSADNNLDARSDSTFSCGRRSVGSETELFASDTYLPY